MVTRPSFSTFRQASRAEGSVFRIRSAVTRSASFSAADPSVMSSATATIGPEASWAATSDLPRGCVRLPLKRRRQTVLDADRA